MNRIEVDAKGLECPQPVILSKKALSQIHEGEVLVILDSDVAKENVIRMANNEGCSVSVNKEGDYLYEVLITKTKTSSDEISNGMKLQLNANEGEMAYLFDSDYIGTNRDLGKVLTNGFLNAIAALPCKKGSIILISNGVKLATVSSYVLEPLSKLNDSGFRILICGTCLDFFKIKDKVKIGTISNALEIMESMTNAAKIIKF